jgi:hypothetical protein
VFGKAVEVANFVDVPLEPESTTYIVKFIICNVFDSFAGDGELTWISPRNSGAGILATLG